MIKSSPGFQHFLRRVHRRYVLLRVVERTGFGVLGGCAAALPLLAILLWRGLPTLPLTFAAISTGALAGLCWGVVTRPNLLAAALEADRQLGWADLLSSAIVVRRDASIDPWAAAVMVEADRRSLGVAPSTVVLNRLGARAWGGIGLAAALVVVLGLCPSYATSTQAGDISSAKAPPLIEPDSSDARLFPGSKENRRRAVERQEPEDGTEGHINGVDQDAKPQADTQGRSSAGDPHRNTAATDPNGHGTGASHSNASDNARSPATELATHAKAMNSGHGLASGGVGESSAHPDPGGAASGAAAGARPNSAQVPPWQSSGWGADVQRADHAIDSGEIPDSYRDVVRGYFDRQ